MNRTRRQFMFATTGASAAAALALRAQGRPDMLRTYYGEAVFRYSICNEIFEKWDFAKACKAARQMGYWGLEIAPFTLGDSVDDISPARRREMRDIMRSEGLTFAGLHWILVTPKWLHITTADKSVRERSWEYFGKLVDFCGDLGRDGKMVLGSPKQRGTQGVSRQEATKHLAEGLAKIAPRAAARRATICIEALDHSQTDVINTLAEAVAVVEQVKHPAIQTMFDFHNIPDETEKPEVLVRRYRSMIRHVHINEMDGRHPGTGKFDFLPVLRVLKETKYAGWVSLEVFDFKPGAEKIGSEAMAYLKKLETQI